jgi:hypothetical protein
MLVALARARRSRWQCGTNLARAKADNALIAKDIIF